LLAEPLESRSLLSSAHPQSPVTIQAPGEYISQQSSAMEVTLVRTSGPRHVQQPLTVDFSAQPGTLQGGAHAVSVVIGQAFTPVEQTVTFPAGVTTATAVVPVNPQASNPGLVPIVLAVTPAARAHPATETTVYLASGPAEVPPSITSAHLVTQDKSAVGIALTFSKPMSPAAVTNIHNYAVVFTPSQQISVYQMTAIGLVNEITNGRHQIELKSARYNPSTGTVTLVPKAKLNTAGTYVIKNPANQGARRHSRNQAQPLTDLDGNAINLGTTSVVGAFKISISRGHPYFVPQPVFAQGG
jgi:hypothetical protein